MNHGRGCLQLAQQYGSQLRVLVLPEAGATFANVEVCGVQEKFEEIFSKFDSSGKGGL